MFVFSPAMRDIRLVEIDAALPLACRAVVICSDFKFSESKLVVVYCNYSYMQPCFADSLWINWAQDYKEKHKLNANYKAL